MAVAVNIPRGGVEITWEPGDYVGPVVIRATNMENGDVGVMKDENDGKHMLTWPPGTWHDAIVIYQDQPTPVDPDAHPDHTLPGDLPPPPVIDNSLPGDQPHIDHGLPGDQPEIDHDLPGDQPVIDNTLPGNQPTVENPIVLPDPEDPHVEHYLVGVIDAGEITVTVA